MFRYPKSVCLVVTCLVLAGVVLAGLPAAAVAGAGVFMLTVSLLYFNVAANRMIQRDAQALHRLLARQAVAQQRAPEVKS